MDIWKKISFCSVFIFQIIAQAAPAPLPTPPPAASGPAIRLSPQDVADLILKQSYEADEINLQAQQARLAAATALQVFDFQLYADYGYQDSKFESPTQSYLLEDKGYVSNLQLSKPFSTGTTLTLQYTSTSSSPTYNDSAPATVTGDNTNSSAGLILEQNLLRNFFGTANRADLRAADATFKASNISRVSNLQKLVFNGIQAFWSTFVAQETYQEAVNSRDRYKKLVESVKKKTGYGYNSPGELVQAQAELENREQTVRNAFVTFQASKDELITLLRLPAGQDIQFAVPSDLPNPPATSPVDTEKLRIQRTAKLNLQAAEDTLHSTESKAYPDLSLVGKYYTQGYDSTTSGASQEMTEGNHPRYYVGVKFQYNFGSGYQSETILNKRLARDLANSQYERQKLELKDQENDIRRRLQSTFEIVKSAQTQKDLRDKAIQQLNRSYIQGRTDIAILIDAMNKFFDSEVQLSRAIGNYQTALSEWAAFRDELVMDSAEFSN